MTGSHASRGYLGPVVARWLIASGAALSASLAGAHHALPAHYEADRVISVAGVVEEFRYVNPHAVIYLRVEDSSGEASVWIVEWAGSGALRRRGILPQTVSPGDRVTLIGHPARQGALGMALQRIQFADGRPEIGPPDRSGGAEQP